ncbi:hypothetical protein NEF87_000833 [Candidatus Lokiarchaeum ossiferum]|uniref:C2H2-type domain-containing protein n=1 Tax=Candidatus Lokiarchaeum ossiferum TaxID=2951803 RepID=A0ABY6HM16_9ARCH|nr:hypothetical protein NEF87_000833 [Candidatus Lokiarchaeum sp. B-35]
MENDLTDDEIKTRIASKVKKLYAKKKKKYTCEFCGTGFDKRDFLVSHMKIRHPDDYDLKYGETNYAQISPNLLAQMAPKKDTSPQSVSPPIQTPISNLSASASTPQSQSPATSNVTPLQLDRLSQESTTMRPPMPAPPLMRPITNSSSSTPTQPLSMESVNVDFSNQTIPPISMAEINAKLDQINAGMGRTVKIMGDNMKTLNKELRYLICEYKSPFIIFD